MKRLLFLFVCIISSLMLHAEVVTEEQALQKALLFTQKSFARQRVSGERESKEPAIIAYTHKMPHNDRVAFYIINVGDDAFVIVSADDVAHQVLGYSFSKSFPTEKDGSI